MEDQKLFISVSPAWSPGSVAPLYGPGHLAPFSHWSRGLTTSLIQCWYDDLPGNASEGQNVAESCLKHMFNLCKPPFSQNIIKVKQEDKSLLKTCPLKEPSSDALFNSEPCPPHLHLGGTPASGQHIQVASVP